jgi:integrase
MDRSTPASLVTALRPADRGPLAKRHPPHHRDKPIRSILPRTMLEALRGHRSAQVVRNGASHQKPLQRDLPIRDSDGRCESDPCRDLSAAMIKPPPVRHRAKIEIKQLEFFARLNADGGSRMSHLALRWTILTMVRTQEDAICPWSEFQGLGGREPLWRIPPERMKMRSEHLVPLPPQAVALLREIRDANVYGRAGNERLGKFSSRRGFAV